MELFCSIIISGISRTLGSHSISRLNWSCWNSAGSPSEVSPVLVPHLLADSGQRQMAGKIHCQCLLFSLGRQGIEGRPSLLPFAPRKFGCLGVFSDQLISLNFNPLLAFESP